VGKNKKIVLGGLVFIFAMFFVGAAMPSSTDDRTKQIQNEEQRTVEDLEKSGRIISPPPKDTSKFVSDEELDRRLAGFEESYKALEKSVDPITITVGEVKEYQEPKQESIPIQKLYGLPASCDGVDSIETWLYPTAEKCMIELGQGYYAWCLSKEKKLAEKGAEARAGICMTDIKIRLLQTCKDPALGSPEVCMMITMKYIYREMISE